MMPESQGPGWQSVRSDARACHLLQRLALAALACGALGHAEAAQAKVVVPRAVRRELDRSEALLRSRLEQLPPGSGVVLEREPDHLLLRVPARLLFQPDSADLRPEPQATLPLRLATQLLKQRRKLTAQIAVYGDALGPKIASLALTQQRALTVEGALDTAGIAPARITAEGLGGEAPLAQNDSPEGRTENRRVEIVFARGGAPVRALTPAPAAGP